MYRDILDGAPEGYEYFLVRLKGNGPNGKPWVPIVVLRFGYQLFLPENEIDPIYWTKKSIDGRPHY